MLNIGGVANVTWVGDGRGADRVRHRSGQWAAGRLDGAARRRRIRSRWRAGAVREVDAAVLDRLLAHPYFARPPPKSLDRLDFAAALAASGLEHLSPADGAATLVAFTAATIAAAPLPAAPLRWLVTGGGRRNPAIMDGTAGPAGRASRPSGGGRLGRRRAGGAVLRVPRGAVRGLPFSFPGTTGGPGGRCAIVRDSARACPQLQLWRHYLLHCPAHGVASCHPPAAAG